MPQPEARSTLCPKPGTGPAPGKAHNITHSQARNQRLASTRLWVWGGLAALVLFSLVAAPAFGPLHLPLHAVSNALWHALGNALGSAMGSALPLDNLAGLATANTIGTMPDGTQVTLPPEAVMQVVWQLRLPRVLLAFAAGAGLALAGTAFQGILRNPLADPFTLGVSSGAAFGAALAISLGLAAFAGGFGIALFALAGAGAALATVLGVSRQAGGLTRETLVLAGVVVSAFLAALISLVKALDESSVTGIVFWIMGSFQGRGWGELHLALPLVTLGGLCLLALYRELDLLALGDTTAATLGLAPVPSRLALLLAASTVAAACVAVSGIIGFVGLVVPHMARSITGAGHRALLPLSAGLGGVLLVWSDVLARTVLPGGVELPVGVVTAMLGGPFFCYLLARKNKNAARPLLPQAQPDVPPNLGHALQGSASPLIPSGPETAQTRLAAPLLEVRDLTVSYTNSAQTKESTPPAVQELSLHVFPGEFVGILGPNGSGKSTLLGCCTGLVPAQQGTVCLGDAPLRALSARSRAQRVAFMAQRAASLPMLTAFAFARMGRYAHTPFLGGYTSHDNHVVWRSLAAAGALHLGQRFITHLSGGELQRVLLARALSQEAPLLLLDEVTAGLDPACQVAMMRMLAQRVQQHQLGVVAALHDINLAASYCTRLIFLQKGRVVVQGTVQEVFTQAVLEQVYETPITLITHPATGVPQALLAAPTHTPEVPHE